MKRKEIGGREYKHANLKGYILYDSNYIGNSGKGKSRETVKRLVIVRVLRGGERKEE